MEQGRCWPHDLHFANIWGYFLVNIFTLGLPFPCYQITFVSWNYMIWRLTYLLSRTTSKLKFVSQHCIFKRNVKVFTLLICEKFWGFHFHVTYLITSFIWIQNYIIDDWVNKLHAKVFTLWIVRSKFGLCAWSSKAKIMTMFLKWMQHPHPHPHPTLFSRLKSTPFMLKDMPFIIIAISCLRIWMLESCYHSFAGCLKIV